ncbi:MAG TPA: ABC transporter permease [Puia sp.]|nr:ABC transporter permease [Puia sp.]
MFKNYLIVALRNFWRNKIFSVINILGLAIGISSSLVIYLIIHHEFSFDKFEKDGGRIYRVVSDMHFPDQEFKNSGICGPLPPVVRTQVPGIESSTVFWTMGKMKVSVQSANGKLEDFHKSENIIFADDQYFKFFQYHWLAGSAENALNGPARAVITESRARTYFPSSDISKAIGKTIVYDDSIQAMITGIVKDLDEITDFTFKEFISLPTYLPVLKKQNGYDQWGSISSASQFFVKLKKNSNSALIEKQIQEIRSKNTKNEYLKTNNYLQPLGDIHFNESYGGYSEPTGNKKTLYGLTAVATFLLLLGCINFINLTTAQAARRAREIGIRKTMGSSALQLVSQFLGETFLLTVLATCLSAALTPAILKIFSDFVPAGLSFNLIKQPNIIVFIILLALLVSILSGLYPAFILSRYQPAAVLKNTAYANTGQSRKAWLRKILTVSQFAIAQFLIIATIVVGKQIRYSLNTDMGFSKEAIINFSVPFNFWHPDDKQFILKEKLKSVPGIQKISLAGAPPASNGTSMTTMKYNKNGKDIETTVEIKSADTNYISLYHLKLLAGRNLQQSDTAREYIANESYARFLGFRNPADIVGKFVDRGNNKAQVVGLIADFHTKSMQDLIHPLVLTCEQKYHSDFSILLAPKGENTDSWKATIKRIEKAWKEVYPEQEFSYEFLDESIAKFYEAEQHISKLLNWCAGLTIFISCLGLLGLVMFTTTQRRKEIGVRKVLGASVSQIVALLSKDFMLWVFIAFIIAAPLAWWAMDKWLQNYAYRTPFSWWIFAASGIIMLFIALVTLSIQTLRSATANPVESLRTE